MFHAFITHASFLGNRTCRVRFIEIEKVDKISDVDFSKVQQPVMTQRPFIL
jgi:hypothetical protein